MPDESSIHASIYPLIRVSMSLPEPITSLTAALSKLPGIGPRSAERLALYLVQSKADDVRALAQSLVSSREKIKTCSICGSLTEQEPCAICSDSRRDASLVCVVERPVDIFTFEKGGTFRGKYHVLGGKISPLNGVGPEDLRISELEALMEAEPALALINAAVRQKTWRETDSRLPGAR